MGCVNCAHYKKSDAFSCVWFESKIAKVFPKWREDFREGKIRFKSCGYFAPQKSANSSRLR